VHTSTHELARIAAKAQPGLLVLYHQLFWGASDQELLDEIAERYSGPVVSGRDLDVY
jgi:ribonuclease BN (tRNA processing enzyme)